jgi:hypothetical protein
MKAASKNRRKKRNVNNIIFSVFSLFVKRYLVTINFHFGFIELF